MDFNIVLNDISMEEISLPASNAVRELDKDSSMTKTSMQSYLTDLGFTQEQIKATRLFDDNPTINTSDEIDIPISQFQDKLNNPNISLNSDYKEIKNYIAGIESGGGDYNAFNKGSKAYGKYQLIPSTMKEEGTSMEAMKNPEEQERVMDNLVSKYIKRLEQFNLPVTKENIFVVHNLGMTGGIRVLRGTQTEEDIKNISYQLPNNLRTGNAEDMLTNYKTRYNI